jgi:hypothetical protein
MFIYIASIVVFVMSSYILYYISNDPKKNKTSVIFIRNILPSIVLALLVFVLLQIKSNFDNTEKLMEGNYFD